MRKWIKLAMRNIMRNKRRSFVTLIAIGVGFAAISLFRGYVSNIYAGLEHSAVQGEGLGHLTIYKAGWLEKGRRTRSATCSRRTRSRRSRSW